LAVCFSTGGILAIAMLLGFGQVAQPELAAVDVPLVHVSSVRVMDMPVAYAAAPTQMSYLWTTGGAGDGAATYTRADWAHISKAIAGCMDGQGVVFGQLNHLAPTAGANKVTLNTGYALVDGKPYYLSAAGDLAIPSATGAGNKRIDRIVLRADWDAQTVRATVITGTDAATPSAPAISTTTGSTYDALLYQALVDTSGVVTVTDEMDSCGNLVDFTAREGGSATIWNTAGTTGYTPAAVRMECGVATTVSGLVTVTFPSAFSYAPIVLAQALDAGGRLSVIDVQGTSATQVVLRQEDADDSDITDVPLLQWCAIGPE